MKLKSVKLFFKSWNWICKIIFLQVETEISEIIYSYKLKLKSLKLFLIFISFSL